MTLSTTVIDARRSAVVVTATPTRDVVTLEVALALPPELVLVDGAPKQHFADVGAGEPRELHATVRLDGRRGELAAIARVPVDGVVMARTAAAWLGEPIAPLVTRTYALPDGELAQEVRP